jgi:hypothetical protein
VPLRILGLGKQADDFVTADVYLLTDEQPNLLPAPGEGLLLGYDQSASDSLLSDLRADAGMGWVPESAWLTKVVVASTAGNLNYDLAVDPTGSGQPSRVDAGLDIVPQFSEIAPLITQDDGGVSDIWLWAGGIAVVFAAVAISRRLAESRNR